jgi:hypothetical protein
MPYAKMANSMEGQETVHSVVGPIAHSAEGSLTRDLYKAYTDSSRLETVSDFGPGGGTLEVRFQGRPHSLETGRGRRCQDQIAVRRTHARILLVRWRRMFQPPTYCTALTV